MSKQKQKSDSFTSQASRATARLRGWIGKIHQETMIEESDKLRRTLGQLILIRVLIVAVLLGTTTWDLFNFGTVFSSRSVFLTIGVIFALSLANALLLRRATNLKLFGYCQFGLDVIISSIVIYATGSPVGISLYLLLIVAAAVVFSRNGAVVVAAGAGLCYAVFASGLISSPAFNNWRAHPQDILAVYISLLLIALVSGSLAKRLEAAGVIADENARNFHELNKQQQLMYDDISEGVITVDLRNSITSINQAARSIVGIADLPPEQYVGKSLPVIFVNWGLNNPAVILEHDTEKMGPGEVMLERPDNGAAPLRLTFTVRQLVSSSGAPYGKIIIFRDISHVRQIEERLSMHEQMTKLLASVDQSKAAIDFSDVQIIGESQIMKKVYTLVERVAGSDASVLITGESGTGKELIARAIHHHSPRCQRPFVAVNCGAIPESLIESELFGHKRGSFTGAVNDNPGLFRQAHTGTILLDEVGELPLALQTKLLRALQEKMIRPVGDVRDIPVDVRVVAATHRDLKKEIETGRFREDLYYRLNVVTIPLPALRERREDIPLLVRHFMARSAGADAPLPKISPEALQLLINFDFPGNIRELENTIERAIVLGGNAILPEHLPDEILNFSSGNRPTPTPASSDEETEILLLPIDLERELEKIERRFLTEALEQSGGIKKHAAEMLGLNFRSFRYRLKKYGMSDDSADAEGAEK